MPPEPRCSARLAAYGIALLIGWTAVLGFLAAPLGVNFSPKLSGSTLSSASRSEDIPAALVQLPEGTGTANTPSYNPSSVPELQHAASVLLVPEKQRGPLATLVRDMSSALAKQEREEEETQRKLVLLQPAVSNYNPADAEQLSKAAVDAATPGEVSGTLQTLTLTLALALALALTLPLPLIPTLTLGERRALQAAARPGQDGGRPAGIAPGHRLAALACRGQGRARLDAAAYPPAGREAGPERGGARLAALR